MTPAAYTTAPTGSLERKSGQEVQVGGWISSCTESMSYRTEYILLLLRSNRRLDGSAGWSRIMPETIQQ
ncbi:hypothetical protein L873DRAFT_1860354 [Choiromyces venosus 120613-1]|uniref:Uncharacterized protein n=1 Tax=Choiromyces venosus 120613-1 TaxID=1336337 RepID=A0A3N4JYL7_9PEZI|nr:hypothetical protein L873DRAFT_1860354 [Choiromyces venosus 120613-1]